MSRGDAANPDIKTPAGLSDSEREELIERARYEVFKQPGANARAVRHTVLSFILLASALAILSLWLLPLLPDSPIAKILFTAVMASLGAFAGVWNTRYRSRLINAKIRELSDGFKAD